MIEYTCIDVIPGKFYFDSISIKAREFQMADSTLETLDLLIAGAVPNYNKSHLTFLHQCRICPFNTIPAVQIDN